MVTVRIFNSEVIRGFGGYRVRHYLKTVWSTPVRPVCMAFSPGTWRLTHWGAAAASDPRQEPLGGLEHPLSSPIVMGGL